MRFSMRWPKEGFRGPERVCASKPRGGALAHGAGRSGQGSRRVSHPVTSKEISLDIPQRWKHWGSSTAIAHLCSLLFWDGICPDLSTPAWGVREWPDGYCEADIPSPPAASPHVAPQLAGRGWDSTPRRGDDDKPRIRDRRCSPACRS
jgi:hypothetical protein